MNLKPCLIAVLLVVLCIGCVERKLTIKSDPPGGKVWLDGEEVGETPVSVPFTYYGTRQVVVEKDLYRTVKVVVPIGAPAYQIFPLDFFTELILPFKFVDQRVVQVGLERITPATKEEILQRAAELKKETAPAPESQPAE
jgi:hypothetical protein